MTHHKAAVYLSFLAVSIMLSPLYAAPQKTPPSNPAPQDAFVIMDTNKDGVVSRDEWKGSDAEFKRRDSDNSGSLSRYEFYQELMPGNLD